MTDDTVQSLQAKANKTVGELFAEVALYERLCDVGFGLQCALVVGFDADGDLFVRSARLDSAGTNWLLDAAKDYAMHGKTNMAIHSVEKDSAQQVEKAGPDDGSGGPRSILCFKGRNTGQGGEGIQCGGPKNRNPAKEEA